MYSGSPAASRLLVRDGVLAAATGVTDLVIDPHGEAWITGTGQVQSPSGSGNADIYIANNHPGRIGHEYLAYRLVSSLKASGLFLK